MKRQVASRDFSLRKAAVPIVTIVLFLIAIGVGYEASAEVAPPAALKYVPGEVIIQFKPSATEAQKLDAVNRAGLVTKKFIQTPAMRANDVPGLVHATTTLQVETAVRVLNNLPGIAFAEPNWIYTSQAEANDPLYTQGLLWGMQSNDVPVAIGPEGTTNIFGSQAEKAWATGITGEPDIFVAICDTGIQIDHPDLAANIWTNPGEIPDNGMDDDRNGYVDDVHGWNAISDNGIIFDPGYDSHGTHVAGTVGAKGGNGIGVAGVNWNVSMVSGKFLGQSGSGTNIDAIEALDYLTNLRLKKGLNIVAINASWGGGSYSQALFDAITRAAKAGILFVAATGNQGVNSDASPFYPAGYDTTVGAGYDSVIAVASIGSTGLLRSTSNFGLTTVDLGAPGGDILSTIPPSDYGYKSGTSMATPHVSGAIALFAVNHPGKLAATVKSDLLTYGVTPTDSLAATTVSGGRLDIGNFLEVATAELPPPVPPAVVNAIVLSTGRVEISWTDQSSGEMGFAIERSNDGAVYSLADTIGADSQAYVDRTAAPGNTYYYRVCSYNAGGRSEYVEAPSAVSTPAVTAPTAPTDLKATALAKGGVSLTWIDRSNNEEGFQIEKKTGAGAYQALAYLNANTTSFVDSATVSRTSYTYRVRAFNPAGTSAYPREVTVKAR